MPGSLGEWTKPHLLLLGSVLWHILVCPGLNPVNGTAEGFESGQHYYYSIQYQLPAAPAAGSADSDLGNTGTRSHLVSD